MKHCTGTNTGFIITIILFAGLSAFLSGCNKKDTNVGYIPIIYDHDTISNSKIDTLNRIFNHPSLTDTVKDTIGMKKILGNYIVSGIVAANDESGNIYKSLYIQNATAGIMIALDQVDLYTMYPVGKKIYVKCKGLYLGQAGGVIVLGMTYYGAIGRIPYTLIPTILSADTLPPTEPKADTIDVTNTSSMLNHINRLVVVTNVRFPEAGQTFATSGVITNRIIADSQENPILINGLNFVLRTSNYCTFSKEKLPYGIGKIRGILSGYNGQYELYLRNLNDLVKFSTAGVVLPVYENNFDVSPPDWITYAVSGNNFTFDPTYQMMYANGYMGTAPCDAWLISPGISLAGVTESVLSFKTWTKYTDTGLLNPFEVMISTNYSGSGDPTLATWNTVNCTLPAANSATWTSSGDISLAAYNQTVYIAFHYKSSGVGSSTASKWEVDSFKVAGKH